MSARNGMSLAMGTYNGANYIGDQLDSLAKQTVPPAELVITDDGSTDGTLDVVAQFAKKSPFPVRFEKNIERLGYRKNFMQAANMCTGTLIGFCDQDDIWFPNKIVSCLAAFDNPDTLLTYHNATVTSVKLSPIGTLEAHAAPKKVNPAQSMDPWSYGLGFTLVFRRSLMDYESFWPKSIDYNAPQHHEAHDQWFFFLASTLGSINYIAEPLALYRQHDTNACGWNGSSSLNRSLQNLAKTSVTDIKTRQDVAIARATILEALGKSLNGDMNLRATRAANGYRLMAARYAARHALYMANNPISKIGMLAAFAGRGGYLAKNRWGVGPQALVRDIVRGILMPQKSAANDKPT